MDLARTTGARRAVRGGPIALACLVVAVAAPGALGASVSLAEPSPPDGTVFPTQPAPYRVPLVWTADTAGCPAASARAEVTIHGPRGQVTRDTVEGDPPSGGRSFVVSPLRRSTYRWFVRLTCPGLGPIHSEQRSFTLTGPNPQPRLQGRYRVRFLSTDIVEVWRFRALCRVGACDTVARRPGARAVVLRFDPRRRTYRGTFRRVARAGEVTCSVARATGGTRAVTRAHRALSTSVVVRVGLTSVDPTGIQRRALRLLGRSEGRHVPNARGRGLGCRPERATAPIVIERLQTARPAIGGGPRLAP